MRNVATSRPAGNHFNLPLFAWAADQHKRHRRPETTAGRHLARRGVPLHRADLIARLAGLGGGDER